MIECLHCGNGFTPKNKKAIYCCDKCRNYANKEKKNLSVNDKMFFLDQNGIKRLLTKETLLDLLKKFDCEVATQPTNKNSFDGSNVPPIKFDESLMVEIPKQISISQYNDRILSYIDFPDDLKEIAEQIKVDEYLTTPQKKDLLSSFGAK